MSVLIKSGKVFTIDGSALNYEVPPTPPTLAVGDIWYRGSTAKSTITTIEICDSYTPKGVVTEQWNADVRDSGKIKAYIEGTKLTIAGNGAKKIMANARSSHAFGFFRKVTTISGLDKLDTSNVTDMNNMFAGCDALTTLDVSGFDTSNVTDMNNMFADCNALTTLDVSGFDTSNVTNMRDMFSTCYALIDLDLSGFNTSKVTNMRRMFAYCYALPALDVSGFNTSNVTNMSYMFGSCNALPALDVSGFDTSNVTDMENMFYDCNALTTLDVSGFDTSSVTNMSSMFCACYALPALDVSGFNTSNVTNMSSMFGFCRKLQTVTLGKAFGFVGTYSFLPAQSTTDIAGATGKWYDTTTNIGYTPAELAAVTRTETRTYTAIPPTV